MNLAERAYVEAQGVIAEAHNKGGPVLGFNDAIFRSLDRLPPEISKLNGLRHLNLHHTKIEDLSPLEPLVDLGS